MTANESRYVVVQWPRPNGGTTVTLRITTRGVQEPHPTEAGRR